MTGMFMKAFMKERDMELFLLRNGYDIGEGICELGEEDAYKKIDRKKVIDSAIQLGYDVHLINGVYQFVKGMVYLHTHDIFTHLKKGYKAICVDNPDYEVLVNDSFYYMVDDDGYLEKFEPEHYPMERWRIISIPE